MQRNMHIFYIFFTREGDKIMDVLGTIGGVLGNLGGGVVNGAVGVAAGLVLWPTARWLWDKTKPLNVLTNTLKKDAYSLGKKVRDTTIAVVPDKGMRLKMLDDAIISADVYKNEFLRGLKGE